MSYINGMGTPADVRFKTLSCKNTIIVDSQCNLKIKDAKIRNLVVNKDETIHGNLTVDGCVQGDLCVDGNLALEGCMKGDVCIDGNLIVTGNIYGNVSGGGGGGYSFITPWTVQNDGSDPNTINWETYPNLFFQGHIFSGPPGSYEVNILAIDSSYTNFTFNVSEVSLQRLQNNTGPINLLGSPSLLFTNSNNNRSGFTATFNPTLTPSYWYYWGTNIASTHLQTSARQL